MNVLLEYLKKNSNLENYDVVDHFSPKDSSKIMLQVPNVIHDIRTSGEMILKVADETTNKIGKLKEVLDFINHNNIFLIDRKEGIKYTLNFTYSDIIFNSFDDKNSSQYSIPYSIEIRTTIIGKEK